MDIAQLQNSIMSSLGLAPVAPLFDPPPVPDPPIPQTQPPADILPADLPPADPLPDLAPASQSPRPAASSLTPKGTRSARELPSLGGIPLGQLKALVQASQNAALLASALGVSASPPLQLNVSIQKVYLGDQLVGTSTSLDIQA